MIDWGRLWSGKSGIFHWYDKILMKEDELCMDCGVKRKHHEVKLHLFKED